VADIVELILADHGRIRRLLAELGATWQRADGTGPGPALPYLWETLAALLEAHLGTAEEIGFLALFDQAATTERNSARGTHDDIREALGEARLHPAGSPHGALPSSRPAPRFSSTSTILSPARSPGSSVTSLRRSGRLSASSG
jgi:Hemerythrin HHE cation binding domain